MTRAYKTEGVVIKRANFGEADRILTIFTKHYGKIKAIAKGVRKIKSRKAGKLELFNNVGLFLIEGKNFAIITDVELLNSFRKFQNNLTFVAKAFQLAELVDRLTVEKVENQKIFELLRTTMEDLNKEDAVIKFEMEILKELGFGLPQNLSEKSIEYFIEEIIEKELMTAKIFKAGY